MGEARDILAKLAARREHDEQEAMRWEAYRRLCGPPRWFLLLVVALGIGSVVLSLGALEVAGRGGALVNLGRIAIAVYALVWPPMLIYVESRRRRGLRKILAQEAPELAEKLKAERLL